ncbi:MAG: protein translocase subunit SecD [Verrucomicrobia bacterium]|nr:protein translocase subunit SecD [Verrucomicrobiota bacterium]
MNKDSMWKWLVLIAVTAWSLALVTPFQQKVKLGLDLKGGTSFTVEVDRAAIQKQLAEGDELLEGTRLNAEVKAKRDTAIEVIRGRIDGLGIAEPEIYPLLDDRIVIRLPGVDVDKRAEAKDSILSVAFLQFRLVHPESDAWVQELASTGLAPKGFKLTSYGDRPVYVRDRSIVADDEMDRDFWSELKRFGARRNAEFMLQKDTAKDGSTIYNPTYVEIRAQMTGSSVQSAQIEYNQNNLPYISMTFNKNGADQFGKVTAAYAPNGDNNMGNEQGRRLGIVLDGKLYSAPTIQEAIYGGSAQITGSFSMEECQRVVNVLNAGALPVPVHIVEERTVDPTLGKDSIQSGVRALIYGAVAVLAFMMFYYLLAGAVANVSLLLVMILLPFGMWFSSGCLGLFSAGAAVKPGLPVLTLPGIAGIVLTIGMAVDANVLIFERIREELATGKGVLNSITSGYSKAFSTILDANVTTLLTAIILFWQGSGAIRGFAVTLSAGILVSMLVVLVFTRLFLETMAKNTKVKTLKMLTIIKANTKIDFVGKRIFAMGLSVAIIVISWGFFIQKGQDNFGVDFTGGTAITFRFADKQPIEAIRAVLSDAGIKESVVQYQREIAAAEGAALPETLQVKVGYEDGTVALDSIKTAFAAQGYKDIANDTVGPQIGAELKKKGIMALAFALVGIIIYISIRFEFSFAIGAIVALLHDVLITVGIYCLLGRQLSLPIVAALLTIVGYSVNDTIVVFDRIREDIKLMHGKASYREIANLSINQTLSRTVLTSLTTLLTVTMLLLFGGGAINDFALALFIGIIVGTYSSIFVATPVVLLWHKEKKI